MKTLKAFLIPSTVLFTLSFFSPAKAQGIFDDKDKKKEVKKKENKQEPEKKSSKSSTSAKSNSSSGSSGSSEGNYNWGIGLRFGEPTAISLKKYMGNKALELNIGRSSHWGWYDYENEFYDDSKFNTYDPWGRRYYEYNAYKWQAPLTIQLHYLFAKNISKVDGLSWYAGFGGQIRTSKLIYEYRYRNYYGNDKDDWYWVYGSNSATDLDVGVDGVLGLEYTFPKAPISLFADANLFVEIFDDPFIFWIQSGAGIRYNF